MTINKNKKFSVEELETIIYNAANQFHGNGDMQNFDLLYVAIPTIMLKRLLDTREDIVNSILIPYSKEYDVSLEEAFEDNKSQFFKILYTKNCSNYFFVTYQDIIHFSDNDTAEEITLKLGPDSSVILKTRAKNKIEFLEEVANSFSQKIIADIFKQSRYFSLFLNDKLGITDSKVLLGSFSECHFGENITTDIFSQAYIFIISKFASAGGKKGGEFFTPDELCQLVVECLEPKLIIGEPTNICDIASGSGTFLIAMAMYISKHEGYEKARTNLHVYMQEKESLTLMLGEVGLLMTGFEKINSYCANTLSEFDDNIGQYLPGAKINDGSIFKGMDYFVGNPPYGSEILGKDKNGNENPTYQAVLNSPNDIRWKNWGFPARSHLEWFFTQTDIELLNENGRGALILPTGVLHKNTSRNKMLEMDIIEGVILLPKQMFQTTPIQTCIVFFNKNKKASDKGRVFMIDASRSSKKVGKWNRIDNQLISQIYINREIIEGISIFVTLEDILSKNGTIDPIRYLSIIDTEEKIDIIAVEKQIDDIVSKLFYKIYPQKKEA